MAQQREIIVFAVEHYNTLDLIRSLGEVGLNPVFIAIKGKSPVASKSRYVKTCHFVDSAEEGYGILLTYGNDDPDLRPIVLTIDDKTQSLIDFNYDALSGQFALFNAGCQGRINDHMNKKTILDAALRNGLNILKTFVIENGVVPADVEYPVITKSISPVIGGWKSDVHICENEQELADALVQIKSPRVLVQKYIEKKNELCLEGAAFDHGRTVFAAIACSYLYNIKGYYSPYMTVTPFTDQDLDAKLHKLFADIGYEGLFEIEFLVSADDQLYFSEINFRNSTWSYAATVAGMNLPQLWVKYVETGRFEMPENSRTFEPFTAMVEPIDYQKRVVERQMPVEEWVADVLACKCLYYYNAEDREPFYQMLRDRDKLT